MVSKLCRAGNGRGVFCALMAFAVLPLGAVADPTLAPPAPDLRDDDHLADYLSPAAKAAAEAGIEAMAKNKFEAAEGSFKQLLKLSPGNISALINLGLVEYRLGNADEAQKYLKEALRVEPDAALAWMMLGVISMGRHDNEAATAQLAQAVYLSPRNPQAHNYFAVVLARRGWYSGAEDELQKVIQLQPNFADAHYNLALLYLQQTPPAVELARRHYQMALELGATPDADVAAKLAAAPVQTTLP